MLKIGNIISTIIFFIITSVTIKDLIEDEKEEILLLKQVGFNNYKNLKIILKKLIIFNIIIFTFSILIFDIIVLIINKAFTFNIELFNLKRDNPDKRFSDIIDEYQAKDFIPFDKVVAIGIPYNLEVQNGEIRLSNFCTLTVDEFLSLIKKVEDCADRLGIKVVDSSSPEFDLMFEDKKNKK